MTARDVVDRFGSAWAAHDLDAVLSMTTDDCVFESTGPAPDGVRHEGRDAIRAVWQPIFDDAATCVSVEQTIDAGDRVIQLWRYEWSSGQVRGIDVFRVRGDLISEKLSYVKG